MSRYIRQYVSICDLYLRTKLIRQAPVGELHPLWILDLQWNMLSVDFIIELPLSSRPDAMMTVVDSVRKLNSKPVKGCKRELHTGTNKTMLCQLPIVC